MTRSERHILLAIQVTAVLEMLAAVAIVAPFDWINTTHQWLLGSDMPEDPIAAYLARALSLFYVMNGAMVLFATFDVERYRPLIRLWAWLMIAAGIALFFVDSAAGLPAVWTWTESLFPLIFGALVVWLLPANPAEQKTSPREVNS